MSSRAPRATAVSWLVFTCLLLRSFARADDPGTDPTEPLDRPPLLAFPHSGAEQARRATRGVHTRGGVPEDARDPIRVPGDPFGDDPTDALLALRALLQVRYTSTFAAPSRSTRAGYAVREDWLAQKNDGAAVQRLFLRIGAEPSPYVGFKTILDFAELIGGDPEDVVKQSYLTLRLLPARLELVAGYAKLPFSTTELDASARLEFAAFGETNRLIGGLGYAGSDLGVQLSAAPLRKARHLAVTLGAYRGHARDEHASPVGALGARVETKPIKALRFGADVVQHLRTLTYDRPFDTANKDALPSPPDPRYPSARHWGQGRAASADARFKKKGFMLRGEVVYGDRVDLDTRRGARTFWGGWALAAYRIDLPHDVHLLPAVRYEHIDASREQPVGVYRQLSYALTLLCFERVRMLIDVSQTRVQPGTPALNQPKPLQADPYLALGATRVVGQLQIEL